jgi:hypothetical protein
MQIVASHLLCINSLFNGRMMIEAVQADDSVSVSNVEPAFWEYQGIDCFSGKDWDEGPVEPVSSDQ